MLRLVAVLCALQLALPPGWCCVGFAAKSEPLTASQPKPAKLCCQRETPCPTPATPEPAPPSCCCVQPDVAPATQAVELPAPADVAPTPFRPADLVVTTPRLAPAPSQVADPPTPRRHVLHCLWLC